MKNKWLKKGVLILVMGCLAFSMTGCKGEKVLDKVLEKADAPKETEKTEVKKEPEVKVAKPQLTMNLSGSVTYNVGTAAGALKVEAAASDGAAVTYQWYKSLTNTNGGGTVIEGATKNTYVPSTKEAGTVYYYAVATSTIGSSTNRITSETVEVIVSENAQDGEKPAENAGEDKKDDKSAEDKAAEDKKDDKSAEDKAAEDKKDDKSADDKAAEDKKDDKTAENKTDDKSADAKTAENKEADKPAENKAAQGQAAQ